ncbi:MAG: hypothetical protein ABIK62_01810, partial [candidate division WOR-3 bacterium]
ESLLIYGGQGNSTNSNWSFGLARSSDAGLSWERTFIRQDMRGYCRALAVAPSAREVVYAGGFIGSGGAVVVSGDSGRSWQQTESAPSDTVAGLVVDAYDSDQVFAATSGGVYRTTDQGRTWARIWNQRGLSTIVWPQNSDYLVAAGSDGVWYSPDQGTSWHDMNESLEVRTVNCLAFGGESQLFAGTAGGAVFTCSMHVGVCEGPRHMGRSPASGTLFREAGTLESCAGQAPGQIKVLDVLGRNVRGSHSNTITLRGLAPGVYFIWARDQGAAHRLNRVVVVK